MVGFVTGLSFVAYILSRAVGAKRGIALTGIFGGFVSSTATTVSVAERISELPTSTGRLVFGCCRIDCHVSARTPRGRCREPGTPPSSRCAARSDDWCWRVYRRLVYWQSTTESAVETGLTNPFRLRPALLLGAASQSCSGGPVRIYLVANQGGGGALVGVESAEFRPLEADGVLVSEDEVDPNVLGCLARRSQRPASRGYGDGRTGPAGDGRSWGRRRRGIVVAVRDPLASGATRAQRARHQPDRLRSHNSGVATVSE